MKNSSSPEQTGAAGNTPQTQMLEDVEESMLAERYQTNAESVISPLDETENFSLMLSRDEEMDVLRSPSSWNPGGGAYDNSTHRNTGNGKSIQKRQRQTEMDDAELLKDLRGLGKPPLLDGNCTDVTFFRGGYGSG